MVTAVGKVFDVPLPVGIYVKGDGLITLITVIVVPGEPLHDTLKQFIAFVAEQKREDKMFFIAMKYMEMYREKHSILSTHVTTATELSEASYDKIKAFIKQTFDADAEIDVRIDPSIIGGFILDIEHTRMDASVAGQLNALKNKLKQ